MALNKITSKSIETGAITADDLHTTLDFSTKTFTMHNNHITETMVTQHSAPIIAQITDSAPTTLDTLNELAAALGDDANFSTTVTNSIATKLPLAGGTLTGTLSAPLVSVSTSAAKVAEFNSTHTNHGYIVLKEDGADKFYVGASTAVSGQTSAYTFYASSGLGLDFNTGGVGSPRMRIDSSGNVGIGTEAPSDKLEVSRASTDQTVGLTLTNIQNGGYGSGIVWKSKRSDNSNVLTAAEIVVTGENSWNSDSTTSSQIQFKTQKENTLTHHMTLTKDGNLGIGTATPAMLLEVDASNGSANDIARFSGPNSGGLTLRNATANEFILHTATSDDLVFGTNGNNARMRIDSSGNVGIGTDPTDHLTAGYNLRLNGGTQTYLAFNNSTHTTQVLGGFVIGNDSGAARITQRENQPIIIATNDDTAMTILGNGNVGINETNPSRVLHVNSGTSNTGVRFESTDQTASIEFADNSGTAEIGATGSDLVFFPGGYDKGRVFATGGMKIGEQMFREGYTSINSSENRWYKLVDYANTAMISGRVFMSANRFGGYNQTGSYREYKLSIGGYSNAIYGPSNTTGDSGEGGYGSLHIGSDNCVYLQVSASIYGGTQYFYILGYINNWQFDNTVYVTSQP